MNVMCYTDRPPRKPRSMSDADVMCRKGLVCFVFVTSYNGQIDVGACFRLNGVARIVRLLDHMTPNEDGFDMFALL